MTAPRPLSVEKLFDIIYEDGELLVVNKPAGLVCHPTKTDEYSSLISRARLHLGPGSHPQLVNRLDRETSGVTLVAKDAATARELRQIWERREVEKDYLAIVHGHVAEAHGVIDAPLGKDEHSRVVDKGLRARRWSGGEDGVLGPPSFHAAWLTVLLAARAAANRPQAPDPHSPRAYRASIGGREALRGRRGSIHGPGGESADPGTEAKTDPAPPCPPRG